MKKNVHEIEIKLEKEWVDAIDKAFSEKKKDLKVDGFRKGAIPKDVYIKKFGIESLYDDAINIVMNDAFKKALDESKLEPVIQPQVNVTGVSDTNLILKFQIVTKPEVKLGKYKNLGVKKEKATATAAEVNEEIETLKTRFAEQVVKEKGSVENGDTAVINFEGYVDGEKLEGGSGDKFPLEIGSNSFIPGFEEKLIGAKVGDKLKLDLKFPENYVDHLKGKDVTFEVEVIEITVKKLPELNKDFYEDLGYKDIKDEKQFKEEIKKSILTRKEQELEDKYIDACLEEAAKNMTVDINEEITHEEIHRMIDQYKRQLEMQGMSLEMYYEMTGTKEEDLHKQMEDEALKRVKYRYLLEEIANKEEIDFTKKEIDAKVKELSKNYGISEKELLEAYGNTDIIKYDMKMHKALEIMKENN